jgi:hypothetical protein
MHRSERPDRSEGLVAEQVYGFGSTDIAELVLDQIAHVGTGFRNAQQAGLVVDDVVELFRRQVPSARAHRNPAPDVNPWWCRCSCRRRPRPGSPRCPQVGQDHAALDAAVLAMRASYSIR